MRHPCTQCGASYRYPHDLDEHNRVGCRVESIKGETLIAEEVEEATEPVIGTPSPIETDAASREFSGYTNSLSPEQEEKESSQCQEPMST